MKRQPIRVMLRIGFLVGMFMGCGFFVHGQNTHMSLASDELFDVNTNTYVSSIGTNSEKKLTPIPPKKFLSGISCLPNTFWGNEDNGLLVEYTLTGSTITATGDTITCPTNIKSAQLADSLANSSFFPTFYSPFVHNVSYYDGTAWTNFANYNPLIMVNGGGHSNHLVFTASQNMPVGTPFQNRLIHYGISGFTMIYRTDTLRYISVADVALDTNNNSYILIGDHFYEADSLVIVSANGINVQSFALPSVINTNNAYGTFILGDTLYIGLGNGNSINPLTLIPLYFSSGNIVIGTPIPFPQSMGFKDLESCNQQSPLPTISALPIVNLQSSDTVFCEKHCIDFYDLSTNNPTSWQWFFPGSDSLTSAVQNPTNICYNNYGSFDVTLIACNAAGCDTLVLPGFINEYQTQTPAITQSNDTLFSSPGVAYQWWSVANGIIAGATNSYYVPTQGGSYYVIVTDTNGCDGASNTIVITSVKEWSVISGQLSIVPNPNEGSFTITLNQPAKDFSLRIINHTGQTIYKSQQAIVNGQSSMVNLSNVAKGLYTVEVINDNKVYHGRFIVQ